MFEFGFGNGEGRGDGRRGEWSGRGRGVESGGGRLEEWREMEGEDMGDDGNRTRSLSLFHKQPAAMCDYGPCIFYKCR